MNGLERKASFVSMLAQSHFVVISKTQGPYETLGYAGFFGVPMSHTGFDSHDHLALCPILLTPKAEVIEVPRMGQNETVKAYLSGTRWHQLSRSPLP